MSAVAAAPCAVVSENQIARRPPIVPRFVAENRVPDPNDASVAVISPADVVSAEYDCELATIGVPPLEAAG